VQATQHYGRKAQQGRSAFSFASSLSQLFYFTLSFSLSLLLLLLSLISSCCCCTRHSPSSLATIMSVGSMLSFNIADGYVEGLVRGYRSGILTSTDYSNLTQCDTLEGASPSLSLSSLRYLACSMSITRMHHLLASCATLLMPNPTTCPPQQCSDDVAVAAMLPSRLSARVFRQ
jgi:hypothetical protein